MAAGCASGFRSAAAVDCLHAVSASGTQLGAIHGIGAPLFRHAATAAAATGGGAASISGGAASGVLRAGNPL